MAAQLGAPSHPQTLAALRGVYRPLLVFAASGNDPRYTVQRRMLDSAAAGTRERDMLLVPVFGDGSDRLPAAQAPTTSLPPSEQAALRKRFSVRHGEFRIILIGKDGGEKFASDTPVSADLLFTQIDAMPMRREEMQRRAP